MLTKKVKKNLILYVKTIYDNGHFNVTESKIGK